MAGQLRDASGVEEPSLVVTSSIEDESPRPPMVQSHSRSLMELENVGETIRMAASPLGEHGITVEKRDRAVLPSALSSVPEAHRRLIIFLDYDGTLTPIVKDPAAATLSTEMRNAVRSLASKSTVAVVSGRSRVKVREFVDLNDLYYAGSHGFDIAGPNGLKHSVSGEILPVLREARLKLEERLKDVSGASLEDNCFSISVHWRNVADDARQNVNDIIDEVLSIPPYVGVLRKSQGRCVTELKPNVKWDKGEAVLYLLELLRQRDTDSTEEGKDSHAPTIDDDASASSISSGSQTTNTTGSSSSLPEESRAWYDNILPIYIGDDTTDEDAFIALRPLGGVAVLVADASAADERPRMTSASHTLQSVQEVQNFIMNLADWVEDSPQGAAAAAATEAAAEEQPPMMEDAPPLPPPPQVEEKKHVSFAPSKKAAAFVPSKKVDKGPPAPPNIADYDLDFPPI